MQALQAQGAGGSGWGGVWLEVEEGQGREGWGEPQHTEDTGMHGHLKSTAPQKSRWIFCKMLGVQAALR